MAISNEEFKEYKARIDAEVSQLSEQVAELRRAAGIPKQLARRAIDEGPRPDPRAEFIAQHGGESSLVSIGGNRYLLPTGAAVTLDGAFWGLSLPPADEWENNRARLRYFVTKLERAENDFEQLKAVVLGITDPFGVSARWTWDEREYGPQPTERDRYGMPDAEVALKRLKAAVRERRQAVNVIDKEPVVLKRREIEDTQRQDELARIGRDTEHKQKLAEINI